MPDPDPTVDDGLAAFAQGDQERAVTILSGAVERLPSGSARRAELLQRLGSALARTGQFGQADAALTESVDLAQASGDQGLALRSAIERMTWRLQSRRASREEAQTLGESALPVFEQLGDELGLAKAWHLLGNEYVAAARGLLLAARYAGEAGCATRRARYGRAARPRVRRRDR